MEDSLKNIGERISTWIELKGGNLTTASEKLGMKKGTLQKVLTGVNGPTYQLLIKLHNIYDADINWILTNKTTGRVFDDAEFFYSHNLILKAYQDKIIQLQKVIKNNE